MEYNEYYYKFNSKWSVSGNGKKTIITYGILYNEVKELICSKNSL